MSRLIPVDAKRADWPRLVANAINRLQRDVAVTASSSGGSGLDMGSAPGPGNSTLDMGDAS